MDVKIFKTCNCFRFSSSTSIYQLLYTLILSLRRGLVATSSPSDFPSCRFFSFLLELPFGQFNYPNSYIPMYLWKRKFKIFWPCARCCLSNSTSAMFAAFFTTSHQKLLQNSFFSQLVDFVNVTLLTCIKLSKFSIWIDLKLRKALNLKKLHVTKHQIKRAPIDLKYEPNYINRNG